MFINRTMSSTNEYKHFLIFHNYRIKKKVYAIFASAIAIGVIIAFFSLVVGLGIIIAFSAIIIFFTANYQNMIVSGISKVASTTQFIGENIYKLFKFNENDIEITVENQGIPFATAKYDYKCITKIVNSNEYIYIYFSKLEALIVNKDNMIEGRFEDLEKFLIDKKITYIKKY